MKTYIFRANDADLSGDQYMDAMRATAKLMPTQSPDIIEAHDFAEAHNLMFVFDENLTFLYVTMPATPLEALAEAQIHYLELASKHAKMASKCTTDTRRDEHKNAESYCRDKVKEIQSIFDTLCI